MSAEFSVDLAHLDQLIARLAGLSGFVSEYLENLNSLVSSLLASGEWSGVAASAYTDAHEEWVVGAREMAEGLTLIHNSARVAHAAYADAESMNLRMVRG
ncbi:WXG100 family type VII secretion target [Nocardia bovistercoris]|uniref:ESAT-6-like protein n=1 Tax=Nocardia bovistercoris TaxID=2785916 RepID=A0A931IJG6_9NOCA|nr:WXG100 family type VII secretion target [Nocardia bovistercoris]MBH0781425.1 WXG100 family type VII secretion target [Nocardia bovistercoris]